MRLCATELRRLQEGIGHSYFREWLGLVKINFGRRDRTAVNPRFGNETSLCCRSMR